jgi:hypothetical protein
LPVLLFFFLGVRARVRVRLRVRRRAFLDLRQKERFFPNAILQPVRLRHFAVEMPRH